MMRRLLTFAFLLVAFGTFAPAQEEVPLKPKPPTANQGKMLVADSVRTAQKLDDIDGKIVTVDEQFAVTQSSITAHNAQHPSGQCTYTQDNPNACDGWIAEAGVLNTRKADLVKEREKHLFQRAQLRGHLSMRMARLRMMALLSGLTAWEQEVVACSRLGKDADRGCLIDAWERHP